VAGSEVIDVVHSDVGKFIVITEEDVPSGCDEGSDRFVKLDNPVVVDFICGKEDLGDVSTIFLEFSSSMRHEV
jgi:hypothetical protein